MKKAANQSKPCRYVRFLSLSMLRHANQLEGFACAKLSFTHPFVQQLVALPYALILPTSRAPAAVHLSADRTHHFPLDCEQMKGVCEFIFTPLGFKSRSLLYRR